MAEHPEQFEGTITIEWGGPEPAGQGMKGWMIVLRAEDGEPVTTVTDLTVVHARADGFVWAELTMFATEDGKPVLRTTGKGCEPAAVHGGEIATATFPFLVAGMTISGEAS